MSKIHTYFPITPHKHVPTPTPTPPQRTERQKEEVELLRRANMELKEREQMYIEKLIHLEAGIQKQHNEFLKLQQLYTELLDAYQQKETQIIERINSLYQVELKYRQSQRSAISKQSQSQPEDSFRSECKANEYSFREKDMSLLSEQWQQREKEWTGRQEQWREKERQLNQQIDILNSKISVSCINYQRLLTELRAKEKANCSKMQTDRSLQLTAQLQTKLDEERETRIKLQYENQFFRNRNADLQAQRDDFERLITHKQKEINKMRHEKILIHRQGSQKYLQRSPSRGSHANPPSTTPTSNQTQVLLLSRNNSSSSLEQLSNQYFSFSNSGAPSFQCSLAQSASRVSG